MIAEAVVCKANFVHHSHRRRAHVEGREQRRREKVAIHGTEVWPSTSIRVVVYKLTQPVEANRGSNQT